MKKLDAIGNLPSDGNNNYTSETFDRLQNSATGFDYQSVGDVASFMRNEVERAVSS